MARYKALTTDSWTIPPNFYKDEVLDGTDGVSNSDRVDITRKGKTFTSDTSFSFAKVPDNTPILVLNSSTPNVLTPRDRKIANISSIGSTVGVFGGLFYAYKNKKSFWGHIGFAFLGGVVFSLATGVVAKAVIKK